MYIKNVYNISNNKQEICILTHNVKIIIRLLLLLAVMTAIFCFSSQPANESQALSDSLLDRIGRFLSFLPAFEEDPGKNIRKWAHFFEFACLGFLSCMFFSELNVSYKGRFARTALISPVFCFLYALSDEIHQIFVPGRACRLRDLFIDSAGALAGIAFAFVILYLLNRKAGHSDNEDTSAR